MPYTIIDGVKSSLVLSFWKTTCCAFAHKDLSFLFFFFPPSPSGRSFQTGLWLDVRTAEKCKYLCGPLCLRVKELNRFSKRLWLGLERREMSGFCSHFLCFAFQLLNWSTISQEEELAVLPVVRGYGSLHSWTVGAYLSVKTVSVMIDSLRKFPSRILIVFINR